MIHKYSPILSSSTLICILIVFSAINKPIALLLAQNFGLGSISMVIIYFVFCLFLLRSNIKLYKAHSLLYLFSIFKCLRLSLRHSAPVSIAHNIININPPNIRKITTATIPIISAILVHCPKVSFFNVFSPEFWRAYLK